MPIPSTIPAVLDGLLQKFAEATYTYGGKPLQVQVTDGLPGAYQAPVIAMVGAIDKPTVVSDTEWAGIGGALYEYENYEVNCTILAALGGTGDTGVNPTGPDVASDAQRTARAWAYAAYASVRATILADTQFVNISGGHPNGLLVVGPVNRAELQQTATTDAARGRNVVLDFAVQVSSRIGGP